MKKTIIIIDPLSPKGHYDINKVALEILAGEYDIKYYAAEYYKSLVPNGVEFHGYDRHYFELKSSPLENRKNLYHGFKKMLADINKENERKTILLMSYDIIVFYLLRRKMQLTKNDVLLFSHSNVDDYRRSKIKRFLYNRVSKKTKTIVYEQFILDYLKDHYDTDSYVVRHTLNNYKKFFSDTIDDSLCSFVKKDDAMTIVSLSGNAIEKGIIEELIELDENGYLATNSIRLYIKYNSCEYKSNNLWITKTYLNDGEYAYLVDQSTYMLLCYNSESYQYRVSGVYFDALTFEKPIIYSNSLFFLDQSERFGEIGVIFKDSMKDVLQRCLSADYSQITQNVIKAKEYYSDKLVLEDYKEILK